MKVRLNSIHLAKIVLPIIGDFADEGIENAYFVDNCCLLSENGQPLLLENGFAISLEQVSIENSDSSPSVGEKMILTKLTT